MADPHYRARGTLQMLEVPGIGPLPFPAPLPRLFETPGPALGEANREIYRDWLGLDAAAQAELRAAGVI